MQYSNGVKNLWRSIQSKPASDPGHQEAVRKLQELTQSLMAQINQMKANMAKAQSSAIQQATQRIPQPQGQPQVSTPQPLNPVQAQIPPGQTRPAQQQIPNPAQQQTQQQQVQQAALHASVKQKVDAFVWTLPENIIDGTPEAEGWRTEARRRYTTWLYGQEMARITMAKLDSHMAQLRQAKKDVPETLLEQKSKAEATYQSNKNLIDGLMRNQNHARDQAARTAVAPNALAPSQPVSAGATQLGPGVANQVPRVQIASNPAIDATRQQGTPGASPAPGQISNGTSNFQLGQPQPPVMLAQQNQYASQVRPQPTPNQAYQQPQIPTPISGIGANGGPTPFFSHSAAVAAAARTYSSNQTPGQGMAGPLGHINGQSLSRTDSEKRQQNPLPINKSFVPQPPQPVSIGPARPTLPGSISGQVGMMGQPAIQKAPTYMLQGTGDRVLDKKKLDELVRQVTGGSGESLQPDVEEVRVFSRHTRSIIYVDISLVCASTCRRIRR